MGMTGKKSRSSPRGCVISGQQQTLKNADLGIFIKGNMGKSPKMTVFGYFDHLNLKNGKNNLYYLVGNFS